MNASKGIWNASDESIYNIGVVSRMTGVPVATLRVWERRYGFPRSERTPGGHRLYSEKEVVRLRWVKSTIDQGMQTAQAIRALHSREREGCIPELTPSPTPAVPLAAPTDGALEALRAQLTGALTTHDLSSADRLLAELLAVAPLEQIILKVIRPTLNDIGEGWARGDVTVATEHLATQFLHHHLTIWLVTGPPAHALRPIVLACAPGEWHEGSLLMLGVLLCRRRWPVAYLGQAVPLADLARFVQDMRPPAVVLVAMTEGPARELTGLDEWLSDAFSRGRPAVAFGGLAFNLKPELRATVPGTFLGETIEQGLESLERLLMEATALPL